MSPQIHHNQHHSAPSIPNAGLVKENVSNFLLGYLERQSKANSATKKLNNNNNNNNNNKKQIVEDPADIKPTQEENASSFSSNSRPSAGATVKTKNEFKILGFSGTQAAAQNWCAKCNTHFRLTSDLVYHMRTFHRKEEKQQQRVDSKVDPASSSDVFGPSLKKSRCYYENDEAGKRKVVHEMAPLAVSKTTCLRCEICNEVFKEKHHMSRHMTSHR